MSGAAPEAVRGKRRKPDHLEIRILYSDTDVFGTHAETHADTAVNFHPMDQLTAGDHIVDMPLREIGGRRADIPMVLECDRTHAALRRFDRDLNHVLRAVHEIRLG